MSHTVPPPERHRFPPRPVGPGSLLWHYAGDHRMAFTGLATGILQLMHPGIGAGVAQHSNFFSDPWDRIIRSVPQIMGVIYDPAPEVIGRRVRDYHRNIRGVDHRGRPYRALDPSTFWWAHATFQHAAEQVADRFDRRTLTGPEREEMYLDGVEWYRRYGVSMRPVPADYPAFRAEWEHHLDRVLEMTPAAERAVDMALHDRRSQVGFLPAWTRPLQPLVVNPVLRLTAIGGLPASLRRRFSIPWRPDEEVQYRILQATVRLSWTNLPAGLRYGPTAAAGYRARREAERASMGGAA
ncbi:MAG TPA: oxygenase MpaB family protein [Acidimicrobiales bacterium]|nr:oxygenase MpaB family protein [Acidimicrobiales bacterium]